MPRARRKPSRLVQQKTSRSIALDEPMKLVRMARLGASETDWRDQRWETPHGRLDLRRERHERWLKMPDRQRPRLKARDLVWISRDQYDAAVRYLDLRVAFLRAYGAPGLPQTMVGDEPFSCPICGGLTKCDPCASNYQATVSNAWDDANRAVRAALRVGPDSRAISGDVAMAALKAVLINPNESCDYRPEEAMASMIPDLRVALDALAAHFSRGERKAA